MASLFKKGDEVVQVLPAPISGKVAGFSMDQEDGEVHVKVEYTFEDEDGEVHLVTRDFKESELALNKTT